MQSLHLSSQIKVTVCLKSPQASYGQNHPGSVRVCQHVTLTLLKAHQTQLMMLPLSLNQLTKLLFIIVQTPLVLYDNHWKSTGTAAPPGLQASLSIIRTITWQRFSTAKRVMWRKKLASQNCFYKTHKAKKHQFHHHRNHNEKEKSALFEHNKKRMENKKHSQCIKTSAKAAHSLSSMYVLLREQYSIVFFNFF